MIIWNIADFDKCVFWWNFKDQMLFLIPLCLWLSRSKKFAKHHWTIFLDIMYVEQFYLKAKVGQEEREANDDLEQLRIKFSTAQLGKLVIPFFETHTFLLLEGNGANNQHYIPLTTTPSNISPAFVKRICEFFKLIFQLWPTEFGAFCKNEKLGFHQEIQDVLKLMEPRERATCKREKGNYFMQWCWLF